MSRHNIEGIDGGVVEYNQEDEDAIDAMNDDTFGDMGDDLAQGFYEDPMAGIMQQSQPVQPSKLKPVQQSQPVQPSQPQLKPQSMPRQDTSSGQARPENPLANLMQQSRRLSDNPLAGLMQQSRLMSESHKIDLVATAPPPGLTKRDIWAPDTLSGPVSFQRPLPPMTVEPRRVSPPPPPPPPMRAFPPMTAPPPRGTAPPPPPPSNMMSIHVVPVRVFPSPFTQLQRLQALAGDLDTAKWGKQVEVHSAPLMSDRDKEFVTKIQLNQMVALGQTLGGKFTFARSQKLISVTLDPSSSLGRRHYSSVHHPRRLLEMAKNVPVELGTAPVAVSQRILAEHCFDLLLDVADVDEYVGTLHPLAEEKIAEAISERTELLNEVTDLVLKLGAGKKAGECRKQTIDAIVEILQPSETQSEAHTRRSLIFRRVPESVQGLYIDMLERLVA